MKNALVLSTLLLFWVGCSKKAATQTASTGSTPAAAESDAANSLPGAADIHAAMASKDYAGAVTRLGVLKQMAVTEQQINDYTILFGDVRSELIELAPTNSAAAEALMTLRMMRNGR